MHYMKSWHKLTQDQFQSAKSFAQKPKIVSQLILLRLKEHAHCILWSGKKKTSILTKYSRSTMFQSGKFQKKKFLNWQRIKMNSKFWEVQRWYTSYGLFGYSSNTLSWLFFLTFWLPLLAKCMRQISRVRSKIFTHKDVKWI